MRPRYGQEQQRPSETSATGTTYRITITLRVRACLAARENLVGAAATHAPLTGPGTENSAAAGPRNRGPRLSYTVIH